MSLVCHHFICKWCVGGSLGKNANPTYMYPVEDASNSLISQTSIQDLYFQLGTCPIHYEYDQIGCLLLESRIKEDEKCNNLV